MTNELRFSVLAASIIVAAALSLLLWAARRSVPQPDPSAITSFNADVPEASDISIGIAHALTSEEFTLSQSGSLNATHGVELLRIDADGTTHIRATSTNNSLSAKPGSFFASVEFGREGLFLESALSSSQTAKFVRTECHMVQLK